ncbi:hypothetical protein DIPPA_06569 [Diplonema papillatum]|nr:hypothetical protein DIPPA_06569 [Diplonema papillatum]
MGGCESRENVGPHSKRHGAPARGAGMERTRAQKKSGKKALRPKKAPAAAPFAKKKAAQAPPQKKRGAPVRKPAKAAEQPPPQKKRVSTVSVRSNRATARYAGGDRGAHEPTGMETKVLNELNKLRRNPRGYVGTVRKVMNCINASGDRLCLPGYTDIALTEGRSAYEEAIAFLQRQPRLPPYKSMAGLQRAAKDYALDQRRNNFRGHVGSDGATLVDRLARKGIHNKSCAENIAYGMKTAEHITVQLLVDESVPDRGHRDNMMRPEYSHVGVSFDVHPSLRHVCVINYAEL